MNILPRILYLFQALPISLPGSFFRSILAIQQMFIWAGKPSRLSRDILFRPKDRGGLALPDIRSYYRASHLVRVIDWCRHSKIKPWVSLEQQFSSIPLAAIPWLDKTLLTSLRSHPTIWPTVQICHLALVRGSLISPHSAMTPILGHPSFSPGLEDPVFRSWRSSGISNVSHFRSGSSWRALVELAEASGAALLSPWRSFTLRSYLLTLPPPDSFDIDFTPFEALCCGSDPARHTLSFTYNILLRPSDQPPPPFLLQWESDLHLTLTEEQRERIFTLAHKTSISSRFQEGNYKLLSRWYRVPTRLHSIFPAVDSTCWRCGRDEGTFLHTFWSCPSLSSFWDAVQAVILQIVDHAPRLDPALFLLQHCEISTQVYKRSLLRFLVMAARSCIPLLWKQTTAPSVSLWFSKVNDIMQMEELTASVSDKYEQFYSTWLPWTRFRQSDAYRSFLISGD